MKTVNLLTLALLLGVMLTPKTVLAQTQLFDELTWQEFQVPSGKDSLLYYITNNPLYSSVVPVEVGNLPTLQSQGLLQFVIPGKSDTIYAFAQNVETFDTVQFVWRGELVNRDGEIMIIQHETEVFGYIYIDSFAYDLVDLGNHSNLLIEYDTTYMDSVDCAVQDTASTSLTDNDPKVSYRGCDDSQSVQILTLYTEKAAKQIDPRQKTFTFLKQVNMALANSDIYNIDVQVHSGGILLLQGFEETDEIGDDLRTLRLDSLANFYRDSTESDLVILFTDGNYDGNKFGGISYQNQWGDAAYGFGIVEGDICFKYSFPHEVGHLFGCRHEFTSGESPPQNLFAQAFFWQHSGKKRRTIMTKLGSGTGQRRILHYSNPNVEFDGHVTGDSTYHHNSRQYDLATPFILDNRCSQPKMLSYISGPGRGYESTEYEWCAEIAHCLNPTNYQWEFSNDGFNYTIVANGSTEDCVTDTLPIDSDLYIRLTVRCSDGQSTKSYFHVINWDNDSCSICPLQTIPYFGPLFEGEIFGDLVAFPNPSSGSIKLVFTTTEDTSVKIIRTSIDGTSIILTEELYAKGSHQYEDRSITGLEGMFFYTILSNEGLKTIKVYLQ